MAGGIDMNEEESLIRKKMQKGFLKKITIN
jgi:hypothetical protein